MRLAVLDLERRRIRIARKGAKTNAGARLVELNHAATEAATKLSLRAQLLGAKDPEHYLLPADLSRHTKSTDPLKGGRGFDPSRHQTSWRTAWRSLRKAAGDRMIEKAKQENREISPDERLAVKIFQSVRFHDLRHTFITMMGERGVPYRWCRQWSAICLLAWCGTTRISAIGLREKPLSCWITRAGPRLWGTLWGKLKWQKNQILSY